MSQTDNILDNLSEEDISAYTADPVTEGHIIVDSDRRISVPEKLKRIAVQYDHDIETVTFDCPRYWDEHDLSAMTIYINYMRADNTLGMYKATNVVVDEADPNIMHFNWTLSRNATAVKGALSFLVCAKKDDGEGVETNHWNSELCSDMTVSAGLECEDAVVDPYPDVITSMLLRLDRLTDNSEVILENCEKATEDCAELTADITAKLEAGEFKGDKGDQGIQGKRGERGPSGDGLGHETEEGGEIFNDYENNKAISKHTSVRGSGNQAGSKGFRILKSKFNSPENVEYNENLIPFPYIDGMRKEENGVIFTVNEDRSVTITGQPTTNTIFTLGYVTLDDAVYYLSGCPTDGVEYECGLHIDMSTYDTGDGLAIPSGYFGNNSVPIQIFVGPQIDVDGLTFYPKLEKSDHATSFYPPVPTVTCELEDIILREDVEYNENLIPFPYDFMTDFDGTFPYEKVIDGVTVTVNEDRSIALNGTPETWFSIHLGEVNLENSDYYVSGGVDTTASHGHNWNFPDLGLTVQSTLWVASPERYIPLEETLTYGPTANIDIGSSYEMNNLIFKPKLEKGDHATRFEPPAPGLAIDDVVSLRLDYNHMDVGAITAINDKTVTIRLEGSASDYVASQFNLKSAEAQAKYPWLNTLSVNAKPEIGTVDTGMGASSDGLNNNARRIATRAGGEGNDILGDFGSADGQGNKVGYCSHSNGRDNDIPGEYCNGGGQGNSISKKSRYTRIGGYGNKLSDSGTEAVNKNWDETRLDAADIHGIGNVGTGLAIFIRGVGNKITAKLASITGGKGNEITAPLGRAGGLNNKVTGDLGDAFGNETEAGNTATSRGYLTKALGWLSATFGYATIARNLAQFVVGKHNLNKGNTYFEVGNGTSDTDRKNAFEVYKDGHAEVQKQGTTDNSVTQYKTVKNIVDAVTAYSDGHAEVKTQGTTDNSVVIMRTLKNLIAFGTLDPTTDELPAEQQNCLFYVKVSE